MVGDQIPDASQEPVAAGDFAERNDEGDEVVMVVLDFAFHLVMRKTVMHVVLGGRGDAEKGRGIESAMLGGNELGALADLALEVARELLGLMRREKIGLVQHDHVGAVELILEQFLDRVFVVEIGIGGTLRRHRVLVVGEATFGQRLGVDDGDDAVDGDARFDLRPVEGAHQRLRQSEARCLDDDMLGRPVAVEEFLHRRHEVIRDRAADTAIGELDDVLLATDIVAAAFEDFAVDADIAELVDDKGDPPPLGVLQEMADQGRLAGAEKAGDDGGRDFLQ